MVENAFAAVPALREFAYWLHLYRRTWRGSIVISVANPLLFVAAIGAALGKLVDQNNSAYLHGVSYLSFLAPGLLAAATMQIAYLQAAGPVLQSTRTKGNYRAAIATPMRPEAIFGGHLLFMVFRIMISGFAVTAVLVAFGAVHLGRSVPVLLAAVLTGTAFSAPVAAYAVTVKRPARLNAVFRFVIMPLYMFSGTFFPTEQLPTWLRDVVWFSPLWHGVELCRTISLGTAKAGATTIHVAVLAAFVVAGILAGRRTYRRVLRS